MTNRFEGWSAAARALQESYARIFAIVQRQAAVLSYNDVFRMMVVVCLIAMAIVWFAKKSKPGPATMGH